MSVIELVGVSKTFPNGVEAVAGVDLAIAPGEFLALVGPSGSGKSTLLRLIAGLETPTLGSIRILGDDVTHTAPRDRHVAMVFQEPALYPYLNVHENLAFGLRARGSADKEVSARVREVAESLALSEVLERRPATLSGGQKRRVALGRALAGSPAAFLLDEPLTGLDTPLRAAIRDDLTRLLRATGAPVLYVTHDQAEALAVGDRVAVLALGRIVQIGTPRDLYEHPATAFVAQFIGNPPMNLIACRRVGGAGDDRRFEIEGASGTTFDVTGEVLKVVMESGLEDCIELGIRPEHVMIGDEPDAPGTPVAWLRSVWPVSRVAYQGHETIATIALGPQNVSARIKSTRWLRLGAEVRVGFELAHASWFRKWSGGSPVVR